MTTSGDSILERNISFYCILLLCIISLVVLECNILGEKQKACGKKIKRAQAVVAAKHLTIYLIKFRSSVVAQYLNCRGDASPHRKLASPHRDFSAD